LLRGEATSHGIMHTVGSKPKSQKGDILAIEDLADHVHQLLGHEEHRRWQKEDPLRGGDIKLLRQVRDGFSQGWHCLVDALEMERFLIAVRDLMEHRDGADSLLLYIKQGEGAQGDVGCAPGRQLEPSGFVLETACRILLHEEAHEPGLECGRRLGLVAYLIAMKEFLVANPSAKRFRPHFKELESCCIEL
jgi:hypothetical protein